MSYHQTLLDVANQNGVDMIRYLNCDDASSSPRITSTGNLKNFYGSVDCRLLAFTVETLKSEKIWTSNIYLHHMDSLKTYPITRSGGCSDPVIAAGQVMSQNLFCLSIKDDQC